MSAIDDLVALQDQDAVVRDLEQQVRDIPARREQELERIRVEEAAVEHAKAELATLRADKADSDARMEAARKQIADMETSKLSLKSNREYSETNALIELKKEDLKAIEDENLELEERFAPAEEALRDAKTRYDAAKAEIDDYLAELDERLAAATAELEEARRRREELVAPLRTPEGMRFLMSYERISRDDPVRHKKGKWPALVKVEGKVCQGCHMELPAAKVQDIARARDVVVCEYCGRMVY